ncbi:BgTH12-03771 [Blumeria graminis f. sp. triticale]|uniref:BgTH12-03771 n=1 Tax=Blumeria graminis f. sp. triticale TaxID=1689686 RepID=A0A9W4CW37_BLUGR|nr:BgTH12-03771 [Blumeria graminis f. sp. triticale]
MSWSPMLVSTPSSSTFPFHSFVQPRTTLIVVASLAAIFASYQVLNKVFLAEPSIHANRLHRSNAVRRRARTTESTAGNSDDGSIMMMENSDVNNDSHLFHEAYDWTSPHSHDRNGQNIVQLLFRVSEDATKRNAYVHRGCACNCCGMVPIRGIRFRCSNCADYDLCESCEAQGVHLKTHIFYKIKVPALSTGLRNMQPVWYLGDPDSVNRQLSKETLIKLSRETGFERQELEAYWEQWTFMANTDWRDDPYEINLAMDRKTFERCLVPTGGYRQSGPCLIFDRMFAFYDTNKDDLIGFAEFLHGLAYRKKKNKWKKIFEGYDIDEDGYVDRKDFLRMFRSYYALYRSMHVDMLEGMTAQHMSSVDAHRLVGSRQPLSSAFGQDGRFPRAPDLRTGEGKNFQPNGDLEIVDGKGVINESSHDYGDRYEVFKRDFSRGSWAENRMNSHTYWGVMLNPPETMVPLPDLIHGLQRVQSQAAGNYQNLPLTQSNNLASSSLPTTSNQVHHNVDDNNEENGDCEVDEDNDNEAEIEDDDMCSESDDEAWPPTFVQVTDEDAEAVDGPGARIADLRRSSRQEVISHAILRIRSHHEAYERWQRRYFYTDEEDGGKPPAGWKEDDDILLQNGVAGESSKSPRPTLHSRSSSKVRFAEDMDDFDTRSNISTSSRSIPERWGGLEIPDAEKDAGKEILYQVTQQAFNELLDHLFKEKEDLALEYASTKHQRQIYRYLYSNPEFEEWAIQQQESRPQHSQVTSNSEAKTKFVPTESILEELSIGFSEELIEETETNITGGNSGDEINSLVDGPLNRTSSRTEDTSDNFRQWAQVFDSSPAPTSSLTTNEQEPSSLLLYSGPWRIASPRIDPNNISIDDVSETQIFRDPTMPQFRPNAYELTARSEQSYINEMEDCKRSTEVDEKVTQIQQSRPANPTPDSKDQTPFKLEQSKEEQLHHNITKAEGISKTNLLRLWKCEKAANEANERGGWGRLDYREFEASVMEELSRDKGKKSARDSDNPARMDYLGSWIEFCIP